jgi:hypothetical protein
MGFQFFQRFNERYSTYYTWNEISEWSYVDCGMILSHSNDEVIIKNGTRTDLYLNIQFKKSGFRSINTDPTTYFKHKNGDNICFTIEKTRNTYERLLILSGLIIQLVIICCILYIFFNWLFTNDKQG